MKSILIAVAASLSIFAVQARAAATTAAPAVPAALPVDPAVRQFKIVNIEVRGNKIWTPATLIVKKGDKVRITLVNVAESGVHGFAIEGYPVKVEVDNKPETNTKVVEFTADKAGIFRVYCHIHPGHVGGQLLVLE